MTDERKPWEQMENEPDRWFRRFEAYRLQGVGRSLLHVYNAERVTAGKQESVQCSGRWRNVAKMFNWPERASAYDIWFAQKMAEEREAIWRAQIMNGTEVLGRLSKQARANVYDFLVMDSNGKIIGFNMQTLREHGDLVKKIQTKTTMLGDEYIIELHDGQAAAIKLGQHERLFADVQEVTGANGGPVEIREIVYEKTRSDNG